MFNSKVKEISIEENTFFRVSLRGASNLFVQVVSASADNALVEAEEEANFLTSCSYNPNQGIDFDEDEEDYYA